MTGWKRPRAMYLSIMFRTFVSPPLFAPSLCGVCGIHFGLNASLFFSHARCLPVVDMQDSGDERHRPAYVLGQLGPAGSGVRDQALQVGLGSRDAALAVQARVRLLRPGVVHLVLRCDFFSRFCFILFFPLLASVACPNAPHPPLRLARRPNGAA